MSEPALETERLLLRRWSPDDTTLLEWLSTIPEVVRYVGDGRPWPAKRAREVAAANVDHWDRHDFGWRVAVDKTGGEPVGLIALSFAGVGTVGVAADEYEIGWWLAPPAWGQGLASEGARALRHEAFERVGAPSLIARIQPANRASRRVAEGLGMVLEFETTGRASEPVCVYRL